MRKRLVRWSRGVGGVWKEDKELKVMLQSEVEVSLGYMKLPQKQKKKI